MITVLYIIAKIISIMISAVIYAMMARALLPFFVDVESSRLFFFVTFITEFFVAPVRAVLIKLNIGQDSPIDFSFMLTYILLFTVQLFLPVI